MRYIFLLLFISCVPQEGTINMAPSGEGVSHSLFTLTSIEVSGNQLIIYGLDFSAINKVSISDMGNSWEKSFNLISSTRTKIVAVSADDRSLPINADLALTIFSYVGNSVYTINFTLYDDAVSAGVIAANTLTLGKILRKSVPKSKLTKNPGTTPTDGQIIKWDGNGFYLGNDEAVVGPAGGVQSLMRGSGLLGQGTAIQSSGEVVMNLGTTGDSSGIKIPFFNSDNNIEVSNPSKVYLQDPSASYAISNNGRLIFSKENAPALEILGIEPSGKIIIPGELYIRSVEVCLSNSINCPSTHTQVSSLSTSPPLQGGGNSSTVTLSAEVGVMPHQLIVLEGATNTLGKLPNVSGSNLNGVITSIQAGTGLSSTEVGGNVTLAAKFGGPNLVQQWKPFLNNLGALNHNSDWAVIGDGSNFIVRGGVGLQTALGLLPGTNIMAFSQPLADIASLTYPPLENKIISGNGAKWGTKDIPNCSSGELTYGDGNNFSCTNNFAVIAAGTFTTNGVQVKSAINPSEVRFMGTNNTNYVALKSPNTLISNTIWSLPLVDGTAGQLLATDGNANLKFISNNNGNVNGSSSSIANSVPVFTDNTGKNLTSQNVLFVKDRVGIGINNPTDNLSINAAVNGEGLEVQSSFLGNCLGSPYACFAHKGRANSTDYALGQYSTGETYLNAAAGQMINFHINGVIQGVMDSWGKWGIGTTVPTAMLEVVGAGAGNNGGVIGNAYLGESLEGNAWATFSHADLKDLADSFALKQDNSGQTYVNAANTKFIGFRKDNVDIMRLTTAGSLGLGTTTPAQKLTIAGGNIWLGDQISPSMILKSNVGNNNNCGEIQFLESNNQDGWKIRHNCSNYILPGGGNSRDPLQWYRMSAGVDNLRFLMTENGEFWAQITTIGSLSDQTLKNNISDFEHAQEKINKFRLINFSWINPPESDVLNRHVGFLAQEVLQIDWRFVIKNEISGKLMIKYDELLPVMVANLQSLNKSIVKEKDLEKLGERLARIKKEQEELLLRRKK